MFIKNDTLKAIYSTELLGFLKKTNNFEHFEQGKIKCGFCGKAITEKNLYAIIPMDTDFKFCCNAPDCVLKTTQEVK